ncbi:MAG: FG-GAP-like repeat-containing protein, partial [Steroidobacteraceae bacterium]
GHTWNLADVNGDGREDYFWADGASHAASTVRYRLSLANGAFGPAVNTGLSGWRGVGKPFDANGDGRADLLMISPANRWAFVPGTASGLGAMVDTGIAIESATRDFRGADLNGDGLGDIAWSEAADPFGNSLLVRVRYARAAGGYGGPVTLYSQWQAMGYPNSEGGNFFGRPGRRIDLNGDGAEDLLMNENYSIARISASGYGNDRFDVSFFGATAFDFNDDGCTDFAYKRSTAGLRVRVGHCSTNGNTTELQGPAWTGAAELTAIDWNGDGREDLLVRGVTNWMVALSLGNALAPLADTGVPHESATGIAVRDLNGDGLDDIARETTSQIRVRFRAGPVPDLLLAVSDGFDVEATFAYRPLTDAAVHVRGNSAAFPSQDLQTADSVVSTLRVTDGTGKGYRTSTGFRYDGLRRNAQGRGSLGFRKLTRTELSAPEPLSTETVFRQDFPFAGLPESVVVRQASGKPVSSISYLWSKLDHNSAPTSPRFPYP